MSPSFHGSRSAALAALLVVAALAAPARAEDAGTAGRAGRPAGDERVDLLERQRLLESRRAVLARLLARHEAGEALAAEALGPAPEGAPPRPEDVEAARRTLAEARAELLRLKAAAKVEAEAAVAREEALSRATREAAAEPPAAEPAPKAAPASADPARAAEYFYAAGAYAEALAAWERAPEVKGDERARRLLRMAAAAEYAGMPARAQELYERVKTDHPKTNEARDAAFRLRFLTWQLEQAAPPKGAAMKTRRARTDRSDDR